MRSNFHDPAPLHNSFRTPLGVILQTLIFSKLPRHFEIN